LLERVSAEWPPISLHAVAAATAHPSAAASSSTESKDLAAAASAASAGLPPAAPANSPSLLPVPAIVANAAVYALQHHDAQTEQEAYCALIRAVLRDAEAQTNANANSNASL
jgi:hypothetical protein